MQKDYIANYVTNEGDTVFKTHLLDQDILLQYCVAYDANNFPVREQIEAVAAENEPLQEAILALHNRFDSHEPFTTQLLAYRQQLTNHKIEK